MDVNEVLIKCSTIIDIFIAHIYGYAHITNRPINIFKNSQMLTNIKTANEYSMVCFYYLCFVKYI